MALWVGELQHAKRCEVDHQEDELTDNEIMNNYVLYEETGRGWTTDGKT